MSAITALVVLQLHFDAGAKLAHDDYCKCRKIITTHTHNRCDCLITLHICEKHQRNIERGVVSSLSFSRIPVTKIVPH